MKSPGRTHHSRIEVETAGVTQREEDFVVTVSLRFNPWDVPSEYPAAYAADALLTFQNVWDAGVDTLDNDDAEFDGTRILLEHTSVWLRVHSPLLCERRPCTVHNRSNHSMRSFPQHWRSDRGLMERICPHGVGHPDPDERHSPMWQDHMAVHGCDGCCGKGRIDA